MPRELTAQEPGFYRGDFIARGQRFTFYGDKNPKWASEKGPPAKISPVRADTKPEAATKAAKIKASGAADQVV